MNDCVCRYLLFCSVLPGHKVIPMKGKYSVNKIKLINEINAYKNWKKLYQVAIIVRKT